ILRMDADTTMAKNSHEELLRAFGEGEFDIMVGTQMVAKGLDFPNVTLTGVVSADLGICRDDYRSGERAFDLLTQVIGRAGRRGEQGVAIIQTVSPDNEIVNLSAVQDFEAFFASEIENRRLMIYPPFCDLCVVGFVSEREAAAKSAAYRFIRRVQESVENDYADVKLIAIGPAAFYIRKLGDKFRFRVIIKCKNGLRLRAMLRELLIEAMKDKDNKDVSIFADIDPADIF
ncbi:MAG: primosomal protein N', partial [Clostridia bacterium]|nr:primosomal protein N' [Clostridia bacterium]